MSFYGYDPSRYSRSYGAEALQSIGNIASKLPLQIKEQKLLEENRVSVGALKQSAKSQISNLDDSVFQSIGKDKSTVLQQIDAIPKNAGSAQAATMIQTLLQPAERAQAKTVETQKQADIGRGLQESHGGTRVQVPGPEGSKYAGQQVTEIDMPNAGRLIQAGMQAAPSATEQEVIAHPRYAAENRGMAAPIFSQQGQTETGAIAELYKQGQDPSQHKEALGALSREAKEARLAQAQATRIDAQKNRAEIDAWKKDIAYKRLSLDQSERIDSIDKESAAFEKSLVKEIEDYNEMETRGVYDPFVKDYRLATPEELAGQQATIKAIQNIVTDKQNKVKIAIMDAHKGVKYGVGGTSFEPVPGAAQTPAPVQSPVRQFGF